MVGKKILVVDDEIIIVSPTKITLKQEGYEVIVASNGEDGYKKAKKEKPDLILLDVMMPVLDGWQTLKLLKSNQETAKIPVVMCTVKDKLGDIEKGFSLGVNGYLVKPFNIEELIRKVKEILQDH